jgi:N-acetyl-gamma-glutamyl-phosphate reductase
MARPTVFIDGEAGTTGLQIRARLEGRTDLELVSIDPARRKDDAERARILNSVDLAVLCLHDDLARAAVGMLEAGSKTRVLDASTAHRVTPGWAYGFPELNAEQPNLIQSSRLVANPGCYAQNAIALLRPLVDAGLIPEDFPLSIGGVQGYSGGGRQLINAAEGRGEHHLAGPYRGYGLNLNHKHLPEIRTYSRLQGDPIFTPAVGAWYQGMLVQIPLHLNSLPGRPSAADLQAALEARYGGQRFVSVLPLEENAPTQAVLDPETLNGTNNLEIMLYSHPQKNQVLLVSRADNLGKGASGAAAQNIDVMLGLGGDWDYGYAGR